MTNGMVIILAFVIWICSGAAAVCGQESQPGQVVEDGFVFGGIDGKLRGGNGGWRFVFESDLSDGKGVIKAGQGLEVLASASLERMATDAGNRVDARYRLWGKITEYRKRNFVFPIYFLPLTKADKRSEVAQTKEEGSPEATINAPNDILNIPDEIMAQLWKNEFVRAGQSGQGLAAEADSVLLDRTGFVAARGAGLFFELDGLGQGMQRVWFRLLPCRVLEQAQRQASSSANRVRFKVAGIVTRYKGRDYLLLQRAIRVYSHGNFTR